MATKWCKKLEVTLKRCPLFFQVILHISRSHGTKNRHFWHTLSVSGLWLQFEFNDGFEMMHKAWCSIDEVSFYISGSSIKFQGHTGWKIDDLNPIWVRLLGRSQLSNPSDLPCFSLWGRMIQRGVLRSICIPREQSDNIICQSVFIGQQHFSVYPINGTISL